MILSGNEIRYQVEAERIRISPPDRIHFNAASVDLTLGTTVAVYEDFTYCDVADEWRRLERSAIHQEAVKAGLGGVTNRGPGFGVGPYDGRGLSPNAAAATGSQGVALDVKRPAKTREWQMDPEAGWILQPGVGYLMHTAERIHTDHFVPVLDGKSSIGRLFVQVHVTAGFGDPGFDGQYTLEVMSLFPVRVYPGMRFCQIRFHTIEGDVTSYRELGHYTGEAAQGPVASRIHETFKAG